VARRFGLASGAEPSYALRHNRLHSVALWKDHVLPNRRLNNIGFALAIGATMLLFGCASESEYSSDPLYSTGYSDGCGTGTGFNPADPNSLIRNSDAWRGSEAYRAGWKKGFNACRPINSGQTSTMPTDSYGRRNGPSGY
jgi:hypothetical protein